MENDREIWEPVAEKVFADYYEASSFGRVRRSALGDATWPGRVLRQAFNKSTGCMGVWLSAGKGNLKGFDVHVLIAGAFLGLRPKGMQVNHKDCNRANNRLDNLEYVTPSENIQHALRSGVIFNPGGEVAGRAKLTWKIVRRMRAYYATGEYTIKELARVSGVKKNTMSYVLSGKTWKEKIA